MFSFLPRATRGLLLAPVSLNAKREQAAASTNYRVIALETPNPLCWKYQIEVVTPRATGADAKGDSFMSFLPEGMTLSFPDHTHAHRCRLSKDLFAVSGVSALFLSDKGVTVRKDATGVVDWSSVDRAVKDVLLASVEPTKTTTAARTTSDGQETRKELQDDLLQVVTQSADNDDCAPLDTDDEAVLAVKEVIQQHVKPVLQSDGGNCRYVGMELDGTVYVLLEGACRNCPKSGTTVKQSIERLLAHWVPEVFEVVEVNESFAQKLYYDSRGSHHTFHNDDDGTQSTRGEPLRPRGGSPSDYVAEAAWSASTASSSPNVTHEDPKKEPQIHTSEIQDLAALMRERMESRK